MGQKIVFMGTPEFGAIALERLINSGLDIGAVYAQPDRLAGRGMKLHLPETKQIAQKYGIPVFQPPNFRSPEAVVELDKLQPDFLVVAAYGLILPQSVLDIPKIAPLNIHASLLPKYRGAAPVQRAIQENWQPGAKTGVSLMKIALELDSGPVYAFKETLLAQKTSPELAKELALLGAELVISNLPKIANNELLPVPQDAASATYAAKLAKADGKIDWARPVAQVDAQIRAMNPWPGGQANFEIKGKDIACLVRSGRPILEKPELEPGQIVYKDSALHVACADGCYQIDRLQPIGRKEMNGSDFANGLRLNEGIIGRAI